MYLWRVGSAFTDKTKEKSGQILITGPLSGNQLLVNVPT